MTEPHPWDGFYAGAHVGYAFGKSSYQIAWPGGSTGGSIGVNAEDGQFGPLVGGLQMGYNYVSGSGLMIGVEGEFSVPDPMRGIARVARPSLGSLLIEDQVDAVGSLRGRVGQAVGAWLFYGTAGVAFSHDVATATNTAGDIDTRSLWRRGWVAGVGAEVWLSTNWSTRFEYSRLNFARDRISTHDSAYISDLTSQIFQVGMNYHFGPEVTKPRAGIVPDLNDWSIHGQSTTVAMTNAPFRAAYSGPGSLSNRWQTRETFSMSGYLGYRLSEGTEIYFNPESFQGFGLSGTHGIAGFPNNEAQKNGRDFPYYKTSRIFLRHTFGLGGEQEVLEDGPNQVAGKVDISRITLTVGKLSVPDLFDNNAYSHDGRTSFLNYALVGAGTLDYAGDQTGFGWGTVVEFNQKDWALRAGYFLLPKEANSNSFDTNLFVRGQYLAEFEYRYALADQPGKLRLTGWNSSCYCGSFAATLANPALIDPILNPNGPDIAGTRMTRNEYGFVVNLEQAATNNLGFFARASWQNNLTEIMQYTDIGWSLSGGGVLTGTRWGRPDDRLGAAAAINGISRSYQAFLAAGGQGLIIGDGALSYRPEKIVEAYYSIGLTQRVALTLDYQFVADPGYNRTRGPVSIGSARMHLQF